MRVGALRAWNAKDANARHSRNALRAAARKWRGGKTCTPARIALLRAVTLHARAPSACAQAC
jgi:hypothetical protein